MSYLIALDDGHGMDTPGKRTPYIESLGRQIHENEFSKPVVNFLKEELERNGFRTLLVAPTDEDTPLQERTDKANNAGADAYISIHFNAYDGSFSGANPEGITVYVYDGYLLQGTEDLAKSIEKYLKEGTKQEYRGLKRANFHVLRETNMSAVLTENGFMDNEREALLMLDKDFQKEVAIEHAKGICEHFGVPYIPESNPKMGDGIFYRVVTGSFDDRENAIRRMKELEKAGFKSFIVEYKM